MIRFPVDVYVKRLNHMRMLYLKARDTEMRENILSELNRLEGSVTHILVSQYFNITICRASYGKCFTLQVFNECDNKCPACLNGVSDD